MRPRIRPEPAWWRTTHRWVRRILRGTFFAVMGLVVASGLCIGVAVVFDADEPVHRGTFRETQCIEVGRYGCRSVGTWVSDDGSIRLADVQLDGAPGPDGTVAASYQPTGLFNDADADIVHSAFGHHLEPVMPWLLIGAGALLSVVQWRRWRGTWT